MDVGLIITLTLSNYFTSSVNFSLRNFSSFASLIDGEPRDEPRRLEEEDGPDGERAAHAEGLESRQDGERPDAEREDVRERGDRDGDPRVLHRRRDPLARVGLLPLAQRRLVLVALGPNSIEKFWLEFRLEKTA